MKKLKRIERNGNRLSELALLKLYGGDCQAPPKCKPNTCGVTTALCNVNTAGGCTGKNTSAPPCSTPSTLP